ncbi:hypothetical protein CYMTET_11158 [Cymbomonas tetramitiformis]|uniref:Uncharacterized protein n=1 Tax=Cymbomonas tetramitiformis TaxID=36881 RepID=A0AAE0LD37_9CHLO|nr:hypothetical protein CYMTET_11158 [Cymbomonas tetramitiformis]
MSAAINQFELGRNLGDISGAVQTLEAIVEVTKSLPTAFIQEYGQPPNWFSNRQVIAIASDSEDENYITPPPPPPPSKKRRNNTAKCALPFDSPGASEVAPGASTAGAAEVPPGVHTMEIAMVTPPTGELVLPPTEANPSSEASPPPAAVVTASPAATVANDEAPIAVAPTGRWTKA